MRSLARRAALAALVVCFCAIVAATLTEGLLRLAPPRSRANYDRPKYLVSPPAENRVRHVGEIERKRDGVFRIIVLGDSFTWGTNVEANATYPSHMEWLLKRAASGFEVYNFGVAGACTADQLELLRKLPALEPDLVIVGYFLNDPDPGRLPPAGITAVAKRLESPPRWERFLREHSRLGQTVLKRFWTRRLVDAQIAYFREIFDPGGPTWKRHVRELASLRQLATEVGLDVRVAIWPHLGFRLDGLYPFLDVHAQLTGTFAALGIESLDLLDTFRDMSHERLQAIPGLDPHPNEIAHRIAAEAILGWLRPSVPAIEAAFADGVLKLNPPIPSMRLRVAPLGLT